MKITRCKYGHYYDKAYFRECPHCCRARGGRDEDIIIGKNELSTDLSGKNSLPGRNVRINQLQDDSNYGQGSNRDISQKEQDRKKAERWIGEAWDELEKVAKESPKTKVTEKAAQKRGYDTVSVVITKRDKAGYMPEVKNVTLKLVADRRSHKMLGAQAIGCGDADKRVNTISVGLLRGMTVEDLLDVDLTYAPPFSTSIDILISAARILKSKLN